MSDMTPIGQPLLEVRNLSKNFGPVQALNDLTMMVRAGEVVALAGDNGAGKTTLIKAISGVYQPSTGEILLKGKPVAFAAPRWPRPPRPGWRCWISTSAALMRRCRTFRAVSGRRWPSGARSTGTRKS